MITLGRPYIEILGERCRLICDALIDGDEIKLFYEVDKAYNQYLTHEVLDSFLIGILPYAVKFNQDIFCESSLSPELKQQIQEFLIPSLAKYRYDSKIIQIESAKESQVIPKGNAVGTGLSSGVDSFETISSHINKDKSELNITHVTFLNVGSHGTGERANELYLQRLDYAKSVAKDLNLELINIESNIGEVFDLKFRDVHTYYSSSAILALQKLFNTYYYASGYPINEFKISKKATSANFDLLTFYSLSTRNLKFYTSGIEKSRLEKVDLISNYSPSYKWLNICTTDIKNCGECDKCIRTQLELYSIDKLELYDKVFDIEKFYENKDSHIGYIISNKKKTYNREILQAMKAHKIKYPSVVYFYALKHKTKWILNKFRHLTYKIKKQGIANTIKEV